jgi:hypothetical protein
MPARGRQHGRRTVAKSHRHGYSILGGACVTTHAVNPSLYPEDAVYDALKDFVPQSRIGSPSTPNVLVVQSVAAGDFG